MSLLGGGITARPLFQDSHWLRAFGILAPLYEWIPAWFPSFALPPPRTRAEDAKLVETFLGDVDHLIGALDSWNKPPPPPPPQGCSVPRKRSPEKLATHSVHQTALQQGTEKMVPAAQQTRRI